MERSAVGRRSGGSSKTVKDDYRGLSLLLDPDSRLVSDMWSCVRAVGAFGSSPSYALVLAYVNFRTSEAKINHS
jgi:hypothetical protein